jgi:2-haloacid dehalogenase
MINGPIPGTVAILERLHAADMPLYAITNWPIGFLPTQLPYTFMPIFRDIAISGVEKIMKPDARLFEILLERNGLKADEAIFIDDREDNAVAARKLGFEAICFTTPEALERDLVRLGVL